MEESPFGLDLFGLSNVLCYVMRRGIPTLHQLKQQTPAVLDHLDTGDLSLMIPNLVFNLKKINPYLPEELNRVLMHFAASAPVLYERMGEIINDLRGGLAQLPGPV